MKTFSLLALLLLSFTAMAAIPADKDQANRTKFENRCEAMITGNGACAKVKAGGGGRRGCVAEPENYEKASAQCRAVIDEWKALKALYP